MIDRLSTLSHPQRMAVFRLLMRRYPDELAAGDIAAALNLKPSTASVYLSSLKQSGLITQRRDGTHLYYTVNLTTARRVIGDLFHECCQGRPDLCPPPPNLDKTKLTTLFICTGNSARSVMAEVLLRDLGGDDFTALSAGRSPRDTLHPLALQTLRTNGHDVTGLCPKPLTPFQTGDGPAPDMVLTVCDTAANQIDATCCDTAANQIDATWSVPPISGHWGLPHLTQGDPGLFQQHYDLLHLRISSLIALDPARLSATALQHQIDRIGGLTLTQGHITT